MSGIGIGELIWLVVAGFMGLGIVIAWIIKAEASRNFFKAEIRKMKTQLEASDREKMMIIDEVNAMGGSVSAGVGLPAGPTDTGPSAAMVAKMIERTDELERDNARLIKELKEARLSLEEVYNALCTK